MKKKLFFIMLCSALTISGCGSAIESNSQSQSDVAEAIAGDAAVESYSAVDVKTLPADVSKNMPKPSTNVSQKWVTTLNISVETDDLDNAIHLIDEEVSSLGGYVENQRMYNGNELISYKQSGDNRNYQSVIRIPEDDSDSFYDSINEITNIISYEKNREDITLNYVDTESRKNMLVTEEQKLMEMMENATEMSDLIQIETRLSEIRYQLDSTESQLRVYDNQVNYATVYLNINEVKEFTQTEELGVWKRITTGLSKNFAHLKVMLVNLFVLIITGLPYIVTFTVFVLIIVAIVKKIRKKK